MEDGFVFLNKTLRDGTGRKIKVAAEQAEELISKDKRYQYAFAQGSEQKGRKKKDEDDE